METDRKNQLGKKTLISILLAPAKPVLSSYLSNLPRNVDIIVWNKAVQPQNYACKISSNSVDWLGSSWQPNQNRVPTSKRNTNTKNTTNRSYFKLNLCVNTYIYSCKGTLFIGGAFFELFFISSIWSIFGLSIRL